MLKYLVTFVFIFFSATTFASCPAGKKPAPDGYGGMTCLDETIVSQEVLEGYKGTAATSDDITRCRQLEGNGAGYTLSNGFVCNPTPGESGSAALRKDGSTDAACNSSLEKTKKMCSGATFLTQNPEITQMVAGISQAASGGNTKSACSAGQKLSSLLALANGTVSSMCYAAIHSCKNTCKTIGVKAQGETISAEAQDAVDECSKYSAQAGQALMQASASAVNFIGAKGVCSAVQPTCNDADASNNEDCQQFCLKPGRQDHPKCKMVLNNCSEPAYAAQNVQMCTCMMNPFAQGCSNITGTISTPDPKAPDLNLNGDGGGPTDYDFAGATGNGTPASVPQGGGSGGGFNGGGGGSAAFGSNEGQGSGDDPLNKDILTGSGGGGGGAGAIFGGGGYAEGGSGLHGGKGGSEEEKGLDLRAFLPGGKNDPSRNPASAGYSDSTITKANGLTNWQKVTRKMNEKRPELMP